MSRNKTMTQHPAQQYAMGYDIHHTFTKPLVFFVGALNRFDWFSIRRKERINELVPSSVPTDQILRNKTIYAAIQ
jgi:hypothetical protein